jgi:hypothetical protein
MTANFGDFQKGDTMFVVSLCTIGRDGSVNRQGRLTSKTRRLPRTTGVQWPASFEFTK